MLPSLEVRICSIFIIFNIECEDLRDRSAQEVIRA